MGHFQDLARHLIQKWVYPAKSGRVGRPGDSCLQDVSVQKMVNLNIKGGREARSE